MTSHRWNDGSAVRLPPHTWRLAADERTRAAERHLLALAAVLALAALTAVVRLAAGGSPAQAGEAGHLAHVFAADRLDLLLDSAADAPLAWLQAGAYTALTDAFTRHTAALAGAREGMAVAAAVTAVLVWLLARRMGLRWWTAAAAVGVAALSPLVVEVQLGLRPENVATPWALGALVLLWTPHRHRRLEPDLWAVVLLVVAVITAPVTLVLAASAGWLVWRRGRRRLAQVLGAGFALGVAVGLGASSALSGLHLAGRGPTPAQWAAVDPVLAVAVVLGAVGGLCSALLRPLAIGVLGLLAVALVPGGPGSGALTVAAAPAVLLAAGAAELALTHRFRIGRHTGSRLLLGPTAVGLLVAAVLVVPVWPGALDAAAARRTDPGPLAGATRWLRENLPATPVVVDDAAWVDLVRAGRDPALTTRAAAGEPPPDAWVLLTPALRARGAVPGGETVAVFGTGPDRVEVDRPGAPGRGAAGETGARRHAGAALADSPRLTARPDVTALLRTGRVDPRVLTVLAGLTSSRPVRVTALPAVPGEDAAGQPRRQLLVTTAGEQADQVARYFAGQRGAYRPLSVTSTAEGVLVRYPPGAPAGLLTPFDPPP
ncbi:hypothetical protein [Actinokineospora spheciospongiae]|uniref:hypothetical protein n=1 Tax=Actinokineospora spheciospongiae TaxID=909613 RepID=UPI00068AFBFF|nr:hypothetical protein [Actinokineospora spheciospongiae]